MKSAGRWQAYPDYRDSGIEWMGSIPARWGLVRVKHVCPFQYGDSLPADAREQDGPVPVYGSNGLIGRHSTANTAAPALIIGRKGSYGKINYVDVPCFAIDTTYYVDLKHSKADMRWLCYAMSLLGLDSYSQDSAVPGLSREYAHNQWLPDIPVGEQHTIADFLDRETARIDALIAKKQRLIELLQEKRTALISHAVTKGLDAGVAMKESGVAWLGEVPAHWRTARIRDVALSLQTGPFGSQLHADEYITDGIPIINPAHLKSGRIQPDRDCTVDQRTWLRLARHELLEGDIIFARRGEMGRCALVTTTEQGWLCGSGSLRLRPSRDMVDPVFLSWMLSTTGVAEWLSLESVGTTMDNLSAKIIGQIPLPIPPLSEQRAIADYLILETERMIGLSGKIDTAIEKLREYRTALISAAVTGKIDVRARK